MTKQRASEDTRAQSRRETIAMAREFHFLTKTWAAATLDREFIDRMRERKPPRDAKEAAQRELIARRVAWDVMMAGLAAEARRGNAHRLAGWM